MKSITWPEAIQMAKDATTRAERIIREATAIDAARNREDDSPAPPSQRAVENSKTSRRPLSREIPE